jgi:hypothetical protein
VDEAYQLGYARGYGDRVDGAPRLVEWILFSIGWACFVGLGAEVLGRLWGAVSCAFCRRRPGVRGGSRSGLCGSCRAAAEFESDRHVRRWPTLQLPFALVEILITTAAVIAACAIGG